MPSKTPGWGDAEKENSYYSDRIPPFQAKACQVLGEYCKLPRERWEDHVTKIREKAWQHAPFPCVGMFAFLNFEIVLLPEYGEAATKLKQGKKLLDLGGGLGQDARALASDGAPPSSMTVVDLDQGLWDIGYDLFLDKHTFGECKFIAASIFDQKKITPLNGTFDMVYCANFVHLFNEGEQKDLADIMLNLLIPAEGSLIFGMMIGTRGPARISNGPKGKAYRHNTQSIQDLWKAAAATRGWEMETAAEVIDLEHMAAFTDTIDAGGDPMLKLNWSARVRNIQRNH